MTDRLFHPDDDTVLVCPECDSARGPYRRIETYREFDADFACHECGSTFDELDARNPKIDSGTAHDEDGLPTNMNDDTKDLIRELSDHY